MCDFIDAMKIYQFEPHHSCNNIFIEFDELNSLENFTSKTFPMNWVIDINGEKVDCLIIGFFCSKYFVN
jgi:hypothetical protein